jgi:RNA recognition motif-containing protein
LSDTRRRKIIKNGNITRSAFATPLPPLLIGGQDCNGGLRRDKGEFRMPGSRLYVGNLNYSVTSEQLKELFSKYGEVAKVDIIQGKGFGFIEMANPEAAEKAKIELNNKDFEGRALRIDEARPPKPRNFGSSRGGFGAGGGGFGSPRGFGPSKGGYSGRGSYGSKRGGQKRDNRRERGTRDRGY